MKIGSVSMFAGEIVWLSVVANLNVLHWVWVLPFWASCGPKQTYVLQHVYQAPSRLKTPCKDATSLMNGNDNVTLFNIYILPIMLYSNSTEEWHINTLKADGLYKHRFFFIFHVNDLKTGPFAANHKSKYSKQILQASVTWPLVQMYNLLGCCEVIFLDNLDPVVQWGCFVGIQVLYQVIFEVGGRVTICVSIYSCTKLWKNRTHPHTANIKLHYFIWYMYFLLHPVI